MLIVFIIFGIVALAITLELLSLSLNLQKLAFRFEANMDLVEPGEVATLSYRIRNTAFWPMSFVGFSFSFSDAVDVRESADWLQRHGSDDFFNPIYTFDTYLPAKTLYRGRLRFSIKRRGLHSIGKVYLEAGDFFGLTTRVVTIDLNRSIVCTASACDDELDFVTLGGLLGDVSVRRFICEDPSLVLGYREYTGAEPLKSISWTQTAKTGELTVRKHDFTVEADVAVLANLDFTRPEIAERCLSMLRTVCDRLEESKIPYALYSNGDLFEVGKGVGRLHCFEIQRRIGISRFVRTKRLHELALRSASSRGYIIITPEYNDETRSLVTLLHEGSGSEVCVLVGKEGLEQ